MDEEIVDTVIALDMAFTALCYQLRKHESALAAEVAAGLMVCAANTSRPGVAALLGEMAVRLTKSPSGDSVQ
jgi:hypothetical protein